MATVTQTLRIGKRTPILPYEHELAMLRVHLLALGYHATAASAIAAYADREGTLEGAPWLEPEDAEDAEAILVEHMQPVQLTSHDWEDGGIDPLDAPVYGISGIPIYAFTRATLRAIPPELEEDDPDDGSYPYVDHAPEVTTFDPGDQPDPDDLVAEPVEDPHPLPTPAELIDRDWSEYSAWSNGVSLALPPIAGGAPEATAVVTVKRREHAAVEAIKRREPLLGRLLELARDLDHAHASEEEWDRLPYLSPACREISALVREILDTEADRIRLAGDPELAAILAAEGLAPIAGGSPAAAGDPGTGYAGYPAGWTREMVERDREATLIECHIRDRVDEALRRAGVL